MIALYLLVLISSFIIHTQSAWMFCWATCSKNSCSDTTFDKCWACPTGLQKDLPMSTQTSCVAGVYNSTSTSAKYALIGKTSDITYDMKSSTTVETITASPASTATCSNGGPQQNYQYYGNLYNSDTLMITHPGISDPNVHFWKIRIRAAVILISNWGPSTSLIVNFTSNSTQLPFTVNMADSQMDAATNVCGDNWWQRYKVFQTEFFYNNTSSFTFQLKVANNPESNPWGIRHFIIMARTCHAYCTECFGDGPTSCTACDYMNMLAMLSNNTCALTCLTGFGFDSAVPDVCITCQANCSSCYDSPTNCTNCYSGYYLYDDGSTISCINPCPSHYYANFTGIPHCQVCDSNCLNCSINSTKCTSCYSGFYLYNWKCYNPCPLQTYANTNTSTCVNCNNYCYACSGSSNNCSVCDTNGSYISYLLNNTCLVDCGPGFFEDNNGSLGPNTCVGCNPLCTTCNNNATFCSGCIPNYYLFNNTCGPTCPQPEYFPDNNTWTCLDCSVACVNMVMDVYFKNNLKEELICDLTFQQDLNWNSTDIQNFITITIVDPMLTLANFDITYTAVTPKIMRITLSPKGYIFIYNASFTFETVAYNGTFHKAANGYPFSIKNYVVIKTISWFLIKAPGLSQTQKNTIDSLSKLSDKILNFTTLPFVQELKKAGIFALLLGGAQATSTACLVNTIPAQNFYEGVRIWASFVFYDVPAWEQNSKKNKLVFLPQANDLVKDARLLEEEGQNTSSPHLRKLFDTQKIQWRFQRTGYTSFFIFDTYMNLIMMVACWLLVIVADKCIKHKIKNKRMVSLFYSFLHKVHQISLFYISLSTLLQWMYFDAASFQRWLSLGFCIAFSVYFLIYELYIYYDMINYPSAQVGNKNYDYFCLKYGCFLKNIRFQQYDKSQKWSIKHWFRPYNYHILSFYKKFLMMIALPIFYGTLLMQSYALVGIQLFEIVRFIITWPFLSKIRNFIRLGLQLTLLIFFFSIVVQTMMVQQIMLSDPNTLQSSVKMFYDFGWVGFAMVFTFNVGYLLIFIYDCVKGCRNTNEQYMNSARKQFYMERLKTYQQQNEDVPLAMVNKWVKQGNLNNRNFDLLPDINLRIEYYRICKSGNCYQIQIRVMSQIFMNIQFNYQKQNNISTGKKIIKKIVLNKAISPIFFNLIDGIYRKYNSAMDFEYITIKTFQKIIQSNHKPGEKVHLKREDMNQRIELESYAGQMKTISLNEVMNGFPISLQDLKYFT